MYIGSNWILAKALRTVLSLVRELGGAGLSQAGVIPARDERLLQRSSGRKSIYEVLVKGEFNTVKHPFLKVFFVSHEDLMSP